jgi:hypothetical protein
MTAPQRIEWPAGTRVRCVTENGAVLLHQGCEYVTATGPSDSNSFVRLYEVAGTYHMLRFKPIVRAPMGRRPC